MSDTIHVYAPPTLWDVVYRVPELTGATLHRRGPYTMEEAQYHLRDIAGYEGVVDASITRHAEDKLDTNANTNT